MMREMVSGNCYGFLDEPSKSLTSYQIANILYNMSLDMDCTDYYEHWNEEIGMLSRDIDTLKANDSVLYCILERIASENEDKFDLFTKGDDD